MVNINDSASSSFVKVIVSVFFCPSTGLLIFLVTYKQKGSTSKLSTESWVPVKFKASFVENYI